PMDPSARTLPVQLVAGAFQAPSSHWRRRTGGLGGPPSAHDPPDRHRFWLPPGSVSQTRPPDTSTPSVRYQRPSPYRWNMQHVPDVLAEAHSSAARFGSSEFAMDPSAT